MRLDTSREETITNLSGSQKFKMNASAKAFQILSSGIYERKIEAIVRELSCNAYDSHVMAGKADVPFRVQLPTHIDPMFIVEDFGVGLSEDEVYNVYTTYFESTKTDSNDVIGALGLGSKTPFSYTDSFSITARKDGKECAFTASIGQSGEPEVIKMYERKWAGANGVTVSLEVSSKDTYEFIKCAEKVYSWFPVKPDSNKRIDCDIPDTVLDNIDKYGYHFEVRTDRYGRTADCKVIMGNVSYDLDLDSVKNGDEDFDKFIDQLNTLRADVFFRVAIGDADVAASRETLSLDDRTKDSLREQLTFIRDNMKKNTLSKIKNMKSVFEAYYTLTQYERTLVRNEPIPDGGYTINDLNQNKLMSVAFDSKESPRACAIADKYDISFYGNFGGGWKTKPRSRRAVTDTFDSLLTKDTVNKEFYVTVIINDCERKQGIKDAIVGNTDLPNKVLVVSDKKTVVDQDLEYLISRITKGCYKIVYASSFWDGTMSANKSKGGGLAPKILKVRTLETGHSISVYKEVDFSTKDVSRWAYAQDHGGYIRVEGRLLMPPQIRDVLRELDLDGLVMHNGNNCKKVQRVIPNKLSSLMKAKATNREASIKHVKDFFNMKSSGRYMVLDGYKSFRDSIVNMESKYPMCCRFVLTQADDESTVSTLKARFEVFEKELNSLMRGDPLLTTIIQYGNLHSEEYVEEVRNYIKQKKGK